MQTQLFVNDCMLVSGCRSRHHDGAWRTAGWRLLQHDHRVRLLLHVRVVPARASLEGLSTRIQHKVYVSNVAVFQLVSVRETTTKGRFTLAVSCHNFASSRPRLRSHDHSTVAIASSTSSFSHPEDGSHESCQRNLSTEVWPV